MIASLITCPAIGFVAVLDVFSPPFATGYIVPAIFITALLSVYASRYFAGERWKFKKTWHIKGAQIVVLLVSIRVLSLAANGQALSWMLIQGWFWSPAKLLLTLDFLLVGTAALIAWWQASDTEQIFWRLGDEQYFRASRPTSTGTETPSHGWGGEAVKRLTGKFVAGGILIIVLTAISRVEFGNDALLELGLKMTDLSPWLVLALVSYIVLGLALISQARLLSLQAGWMAQGITISPKVGSRWISTTLFFLAGIALVTALLPIGSTTGLARLLEVSMKVIFGFVAGLFGAVLALADFLLSLLGLTLGDGEQTAFQVSPPPAEMAAGTSARWLQTVTLAGLWIILAMAIGYSLFLVIRLLRSRDWANMDRLWKWLCRLFRRARSSAETIARRIAAIPTTGGDDELLLPRPGAIISSRDHLARERVLRYYVSAVQRAGKMGVPRPHNATPDEYRQELLAAWPETADSVHELTNSFTIARYSRQPISDKEARRAKSVLGRFKRQLKRHLTGT